jgi:drug/metabolite transporter (DMT)-like permease
LTFSGRFRSDGASGAIVLLVVSSVLWGSSFVTIKLGLVYVNAYDFAFLRLALAAAIMVPALALRSGIRLGALKDWSVWILGVLNGLGFSLQYIGLLYTSAGRTALLVNMNVILVALLSGWMFGERIGVGKGLGVALGVVGAALITTNGDLSTLGQGNLLGDVLVFSAGLVWAFFIVVHKRILTQSERNVIELSTVVMLTTAVALLPAAVFLGGLDLVAIPAIGWGWVAFTAIMCTVFPYGLWVVALRAVTATVATVVSVLEIVAAMIFSAILLGEVYRPITILGAIMILLSIFAVARS